MQSDNVIPERNLSVVPPGLPLAVPFSLLAREVNRGGRNGGWRRALRKTLPFPFTLGFVALRCLVQASRSLPGVFG